MLRGVLIGLGAVAAAAGLGLLAAGEPGGVGVLIAGVLVLVGTLYERVRYKRLMRGAPGPRWQRTAERFIDTESGKEVTVWIEPDTGERAYVTE